jgi:hypothetical protein
VRNGLQHGEKGAVVGDECCSAMGRKRMGRELILIIGEVWGHVCICFNNVQHGGGV